jgi:hypothetical protein
MDSVTRTRGFVTMAVGDYYYLLAKNLLTSYKFHNHSPFPFAIICDKENEVAALFDDVVIIGSPSYSYLDKLRLAELSPYDETIFIDADSLVLKDLGGLWNFVERAPDFGIFGAVYDPASEKGKIQLDRGGRFRDRMHFPCTCQGGMYFIRKSDKLAPFTELSLFILKNFSEFQEPGNPNPSDDTIFPLACSIFNFPPPEDWYKIFCFVPESDIHYLNVVEGKISYDWKWLEKTLGPECYFVHFTTKATKKWLYNREMYHLSCSVRGKKRSFLRLAIIWLSCRGPILSPAVVYYSKVFVYRVLRLFRLDSLIR